MMLMSSMKMMSSTATRSSLEIMLEKIQQREEQGIKELPPALPVRPVSKARLPPARRSLPINFQNIGLSENTKENKAATKLEDAKSSFELGEFEDEKTETEAFDESQMSVESDDDAALMAVPVSPEECECGDDVGFGLKKIGTWEDPRERELQGILGIQKYFRGHQARCYYRELKRGICTLQSFVRGENARKDYKLLIERLTAIVVLQKHVKRHMAWGTQQERQRAVLCLQAGTRRWLTRKHLRCTENLKRPSIENTNGMKNSYRKIPETKDHIWLPPSVLADLQKQVIRAEAALEKKEEENATLQQQIQQFEKKWSQYEAKMKSMEEMWQDQLRSLQISLAGAKTSLAAEDTTCHPGGIAGSPEYKHYNACNGVSTGTRTPTRSSLVKFSDPSHDVGPQQMNGRLNAISGLIEQQKIVFDNDASVLLKGKSGQSASRITPDIELQKLKLRFEAWKKDYKVRLQETKTTLQKLSNSETEKSHKRWWRR
ncbi:hypothetical protein F0562_018429 [Nyssa sinensis]|uniref:Myosin motor domain-containing protein n=1 Tax=Nyssa sinensis TaxID=561372 RepID=A0A5J4ZDI8_9ASTE|nr:hypothetical protein F0562_018429 [Nyssa sinensis]